MATLYHVSPLSIAFIHYRISTITIINTRAVSAFGFEILMGCLNVRYILLCNILAFRGLRKLVTDSGARRIGNTRTYC